MTTGVHSSRTTIPTLSDLPLELRRIVLSHLSRSESCKLARVSKAWNEVAEERVWSELKCTPRSSGCEQDITWYTALSKSYCRLSAAMYRVPARAGDVRKIDMAISPYGATYGSRHLLSLIGTQALHVKLDYVPGVVPTPLSPDSLRASLAHVHLPVARSVILSTPLQIDFGKPAGPLMCGPTPWKTTYRYWVNYGDVLQRLPTLCSDVRQVGVVNEHVHSTLIVGMEGDVHMAVQEQPASDLDVIRTMDPAALLAAIPAIESCRRLTGIRLLSPVDAMQVHEETESDSASRDMLSAPDRWSDVAEQCLIFRFHRRSSADDSKGRLYLLSFALVHRYPHATTRRSYHLVGYAGQAWRVSEAELRGMGLWARMEGTRGGALDLPEDEWEEMVAALGRQGDGHCL